MNCAALKAGAEGTLPPQVALVTVSHHSNRNPKTTRFQHTHLHWKDLCLSDGRKDPLLSRAPHSDRTSKVGGLICQGAVTVRKCLRLSAVEGRERCVSVSYVPGGSGKRCWHPHSSSEDPVTDSNMAGTCVRTGRQGVRHGSATLC